jgi:hypothetical protein
MAMDSKVMRFKKGRKAFKWAVSFAILMVIVYALLYQFAPFSQFVNDLSTNLLNDAIAVICAVLATLVRGRYSKDEVPRAIWTNLAVSLWLWAFAEVIWTYYNMVFGEVGLTIADAFWMTGYVFFFIALFIQYHILFRPTLRQAGLAVVLTAIALVLVLLVSGWLLVRYAGMTLDNETLIYIFYPTADLIIAFMALRLAHRFHSGALGYPWLGLFVFALADLMYAWLDLTGMYTWSLNQGNLLTAVADITYLAAYLAIALGYYAQWLLLRYGPIFNVKRKA